MSNLSKLKNGKYWNADSVELAPNKLSTRFYTKWVNFLTSNNEWQTIDTTLIDMGSYWGMNKAPFEVKIPKLSTGEASFVSNNRWDVFKKEKIDDAPFAQYIIAQGVNAVSGVLETGDLGWGEDSYVIYKGAYAYADLIYYVHCGRAPRLRKLIRFNQALTQDTSYVFNLRYSSDPDVEFKEKFKNKWDKQTEIKTNRAIKHKPSWAVGNRGIGMKDFYIWDSGVGLNQKKQLVDITYEKQGQNYILTKFIPASFFQNVVYPVYTDTTSTFTPDPDVETNSVDGLVYASPESATWSVSHDATSGAAQDNLTSGAPLTGLNGGLYAVRRAIFLFYTASIPDTDTIDSATLRVWLNGKATGDNDGNDFWVVTLSSPATNTALVAGDFDQVGEVTNPTEQSARIDSGLLTGDANNTWTLNATGLTNISKTGVSKFGLREGHDCLNDVYDGANNTFNSVTLRFAEQTTTDRDPLLTVVHSAASISARSFGYIF